MKKHNIGGKTRSDYKNTKCEVGTLTLDKMKELYKDAKDASKSEIVWKIDRFFPFIHKMILVDIG